jgi:hypothetical protein
VNQYYRLEYDLTGSIIFDSIRVQVVIPDYNSVEAKIGKVQKVRIVAPMLGQQFISLVPDRPLIILWDQGGHAWSEFEKYRQLALPYDEFISQVILQIDEDPKVLRTYFGYVRLHIVGGGSEMVEYMKYLNGFSDYNFNGYSNVSNGMGLVTSVTENFKDSLRFDYETRQTLLKEPRLKKLKISPWDK